MEVPRLRVKSELQLPAYATGTAMCDPSCICSLHHSSWQCQILNSLSEVGDWTLNLMLPSQICFHCVMTGTPVLLHFDVYFPFPFRAAPVAYGRSQAMGQIRCSWQPMPQPQQCQIWAMSGTYTTAHGNARSLTHWARPETEPVSSRRVVRFLTHWARTGTLINNFQQKARK